MNEFRLTQISDPHLARRLTKLTANFDAVSDYIDATRPDLVVNTGDLAFDAPTSPDDLEFARALHDALPVACRYLPGNHDVGDNPTQIGAAPTHPVTERRRQAFIGAFGDDRGKPVPDDVAPGAVAAVEIDGQCDRDRKSRRGA